MSDRHLAKMTGRDWLWPVIFLLLGVGGAFAAHHFFFQAFPEASVDLRLTRQEVEVRALDFLRGRGLNTDGYHVSTAFNFDDEAKTYLERELGAEEANRLMSSTVRIWNWRTRLIKPPQIEEMVVHFTTTGELMGYTHIVKEDDPGASLSKTEAQRIAEVFLLTELRIDLKKYHLVEDAVKTRPKRLDYTLTWEENDFKAKDATHRLTVTVLGDLVGGLKDFLKIPDQWSRDYEKLRSRNELLEIIATALYVLLIIVGLFVIFGGGRAKQIHWKTLLAIGGVLGFLIMLSTLNEIPLALQGMPTIMSYGAMTATIVVGAILAGVGAALYVMMLAGAGEPLYRKMSPNRVSLDHLFTVAGLRTKEFFTSTLIGYGMAGMHIGLVVLFYMAARHIGAWAPMDVNYDNTVSTPFPWLSPLAMASFASSTEEFGFRLFAIPLILGVTQKWFGKRAISTWIAIVIPAFLWGFLHSNYPQQPAWVRGVEVGLIGIVAGWVLVNFGILATLVWHYTVDAVLMGMFLLRSDIVGFKIAGALVGDAVLIPLLISLVLYVEARGFVSDRSILNGAGLEPALVKKADETADLAEAAAQQKAAPRALPFTFIPTGAMRFLVGAGVVLLIALAVVERRHEDRRIAIEVTPVRAEASATEYLRQKGVPVEQYRRVTTLQDAIPGLANDYLVEKTSKDRAAAVYHDQIHLVHWRTRFFRELQKEEFTVLTNVDGKVERYVHTLAEDAPGARLDHNKAFEVATAALVAAGVNPGDYQLLDHKTEVRKNRDDHEIIWESKQKLAGDATHRITIEVIGDEVNGPRHWIKIPEDWERKHQEQGLRVVLTLVFFSAAGLAAIIFAALAIPKIAVYWRLHMTLGAIVALLRVVAIVNDVPQWSENYSTAIAWSNSLTQDVLGGVMQVMLAFLGVAALGVIAEVLLRDRFGEVSFWPASGPDRARALLEGLIAGLAGIFVMGGVGRLASLVADKIPAGVRGAESNVAAYSLALSPGLAIFLSALMATVWGTLLCGAVLGTLLRISKRPAWLNVSLTPFAVALTVLIMAIVGSQEPAQFAQHLLTVGATAAALYWLVSVLRFNVFSYAVMVFAGGSAGVVAMWPNAGLHAYAAQAAVGLAAAIVAYIVWIKRELSA